MYELKTMAKIDDIEKYREIEWFHSTISLPIKMSAINKQNSIDWKTAKSSFYLTLSLISAPSRSLSLSSANNNNARDDRRSNRKGDTLAGHLLVNALYLTHICPSGWCSNRIMLLCSQLAFSSSIITK